MGNVGRAQRYQIDLTHFRFTERGQLVELAPSHCPAGHVLTGDTVLVGNIPCMCLSQSLGQRTHRAWRCRRCDLEWIWPGCAERPHLPVWDGANPPPRGQRPPS